MAFHEGSQRHFQWGLLLGGMLLSGAVNATLINFDDLAPIPCDDFDCRPLELTNEYIGLGVTFENGWLASPDPAPPYVASGPNVLVSLAHPGMVINFSGDLPTSVSFYVSTIMQDTVFIEATGPAGAVGFVATDGWRGTESDSTPYRDLQLVTFSGAEISRIRLDDYSFRRADIIIDDLSFTRETVAVSEPSALALLMGGLGALWWRRLRSSV